MDSDSDDSQKFFELSGGKCPAGFAHEDEDDDDDESCFLSGSSLSKKNLKRPQAAVSPVAVVLPAKKAKPALNDWDGLEVSSSALREEIGQNTARPQTQPSASYMASRDALRRNQEMLAKLQKPADLNISDEEEDAIEIVEAAEAQPVDNGKPISLNLRLSEKVQTKLSITMRAPFSKLFELFAATPEGAEVKARLMREPKFLFDGAALKPGQTPHDLDMDDDDDIDVM